MPTANEKGDALEHAIHCIEEAMHRNVPALKGSNAIIERNKIIRKDGVSHEIDIWVHLNPGTLYETTHILECKNWNRPVSTDEVFKLTGKRKALNVSSGTIIAREFTRDAEALAQQEHVSLHHFSDNFWSPLDSLQCAATTHEVGDATVTVRFRHFSVLTPSTIDHRSAVCRYSNRVMRMQGLIIPMVDQHIHGIRSHDPRSQLEGLHTGRTGFGCSFENGELFIDDHEVADIIVKIDYTINVQHARIAAKFDVEHRGGFIRMEYPPGTFGQKEVALEILTNPSGSFYKKMG